MFRQSMTERGPDVLIDKRKQVITESDRPNGFLHSMLRVAAARVPRVGTADPEDASAVGRLPLVLRDHPPRLHPGGSCHGEKNRKVVTVSVAGVVAGDADGTAAVAAPFGQASAPIGR
ncbi:hypothetical protein ACFFUA_03260 [Streptomyces heliomycini]|uniref:Uncharacterized protein n=1 Tax=Streptomyces heliomycini TaxID=284032 RepID=A0ABV5L2V0_9ACTN